MANIPPAPEEMLQESDDWAFQTRIKGLSDELEGYMLASYHQGFSIYQHHLRGIVHRVNEAGGIAEIRYVADPMLRHSRSPWRNELQLQDGSTIGLAEIVATPPITEELPVPPGLPDTATRTHEVQLLFGGKYVRTNAEDVLDLERMWFPHHQDRPFEVLIQDPTYFPEDMGITERVVTDLHEPFRPDYGVEKPHVVQQSFSLDGKIWRPHLKFDDTEDVPDPYLDPLNYRRWALMGDARLELEFQAPTMVKSRNNFSGERVTVKKMKTVIEHPGRINVDSSESTHRNVLEQFERYMRLMNSLYVELVPEDERTVIDQEIAQMRSKETPALPAGKADKKKKAKK